MSVLNHFSYSGLDTYRKCPAQFQFRYIDQIVKTDEGIEAFMGKRVHEVLEFLYQEIHAGKTASLDQLLDHYQKQWKNNWHERIAIVNKNETKENYYKLGMDCIARYYRKYQPFSNGVIGIELEMNFTLDNNPQYKMKGYIDRLDRPGNGSIEIHDYKTGKNVMSQKNADEDGQLAIYQLAIQQKFDDVQSIKLVWHFVRYGIEIRSTRTNAQLQLLTNNLKNKIDEIRKKESEGNPFPAKESILCNWCYYWEECPMKKTSNPFVNLQK